MSPAGDCHMSQDGCSLCLPCSMSLSLICLSAAILAPRAGGQRGSSMVEQGLFSAMLVRARFRCQWWTEGETPELYCSMPPAQP